MSILKRVGYNNSESCSLRNSVGYDIQKLIRDHGHATRYEFDKDFIEDLKLRYTTVGRESVEEYLLSLASNVISALDLHFSAIAEKEKRNIYYAWIERLIKFMKDKPQECGDEDDDYDLPEEVLYKTYYPESFAEFLANDPEPDKF